MKEMENHAATVDRMLKAIAVHEGDDAVIQDARKLILADLDLIQAGEKAYHQTVQGATCELIIRFGCAVVTTERMVADGDGPRPNSHPEMSTPALAAARVPIRWGGGHCWYIGRCWICIDWVCGS